MKAGKHTYALLGAIAFGMAMSGCPDDEREGDGILKPLDTFDADTTPPPDTSIVRLDNGEPCKQDAECVSNLCANASGEGRICTEACGSGDTCPTGLVCVSDGDQSLCVKADVVNCQPCTDAASCNVSGLTGNKCITYGDEGSFCGQGCTGDGDCPDGYACTDGGCKRSSGACECNAAGIALEAQTTCAITNTFGSCEGTRGCGAGGLSRCYAQTPAAEICNGRDDDCDEETDEGTSGAECDLTNEFGTCKGVVECTDGVPLCVGRAPAAEICNGIDDNCNGTTDEGSPDVDEDDIADCVDDDWDNDGSKNPNDCQPLNQLVHPGAIDVCNGIDDDCSRLIDDGPAAGCGCYVCGGVDGCRTSCDTNADVIAGYVCDTEDFDHDENTHECLPSVCGNAIVEAAEVCDDGENVGAYGGCFRCIERGPYCGDGRRDHAFELCDDGADNGKPNKCNTTCSGPTPPECGNGVQETGEACDLGEANSNQPNAVCRTDCSPRRCGDGVVDNGEGCDAGNANGTSLCGCQNSCVFTSANTVCRATSGGACDVTEFCTGAGACPADTHLNGIVCRPSSGVCDVAESCNGQSAQCPLDGVAANTTVCRPSIGLCDIEDKCDGTSKLCPANDAVSPSTVVCRQSAGLCDPAENCTGSSPQCPSNKLHDGATTCRPADGECDIPEVCSGQDAACPIDKFLADGTVCHESMGGCDPEVTCAGGSADCEYDGFFGAGTVCREAGGACDSADICDGVSPECPETGYDDNSTVCRPAEGACDVEERCSGESAECPEDSLFGWWVPCRESVGDCDYTEYCEGNSTACPDDDVVQEGIFCHWAEGECDTNATCNGVTGECPYTGLAGPETVCRGALGECDVAEYCTGDNTTCPYDLYADNTTVCRSAEGACDADDYCLGWYPWCPWWYDEKQPQGTVCRGGGDDCNPAEECDGESNDCPVDYQWPDGSDCTETASCSEPPCACDTGASGEGPSMCVPSCGNGTIEGNEVCDDGEMNGARNYCNMMCAAPCGLDGGWFRQGGGFDWDESNAVVVGGDGVAFDAGYYGTNSPNFGAPSAPGFGTYEFGDNLFIGRGGTDVFVQATDADNQPVWAACAGGYDYDEARGVAVDDSGVWVTGTYRSWITFGCCEVGNALPATLLGGQCPTLWEPYESYEDEIFVARYDRQTGEFLWAQSGGVGGAWDYAEDIAASPKGGAVMVGSVQGYYFWDPGTATFGNTSVSLFGFDDAVVVAYDQNGGVRWAHALGAELWDYATDVTMDGEGNAYVMGQYDDNITIGGTLLESPFDAEATWIARFSPEGNIDWAVSVPDSIATHGSSWPVDIAYGCVGSTPTCTVYALIGDDEFGDFPLLFIDPATGATRDNDWLEPGPDAWFNALTTDRSGDLTFAGEYCGEAEFGATTLVGDDCSNQSIDGFLARMRATDREWSWAKDIGIEGGSDQANDVATGPGGAVWVAGGFSGLDASCRVDYAEDFESGLGNWRPQGWTQLMDDGTVQLTEASQGSQGQLVNYIDVVEDGLTRVSFDYYAATVDGLDGADGVALSIVHASPGELADLLDTTEAGGGIGYWSPDNTLPAVTVELDSYMNEADLPISGEQGHIAVTTGLQAYDELGRYRFFGNTLEDGQWHRVTVEMFGTQLRVWFDGSPVISAEVGVAFVGGRMFFSGATGALYADQRIDNLTVSNCAYDFGGEIEPWGQSDAFVAKYVPSFDGCFECGDGQVQLGEACDDGNVSSCEGTCDDLCSTEPANVCGDGWAECGEDYDLAGGDEDADMCTQQYGNAWCFEIADNDPTTNNNFTRNPVRPGVPAALGAGVPRENWRTPSTTNPGPENGLGGNPTQLDVCPATRSDGTEVNHQALSGLQWLGDKLNPGATTEGDRTQCTGAVTGLVVPDFVTSDRGINKLAAAVECEDYFEFVSSTGDEVAFDFDNRATNQGPTQWALYVSISGAPGTWGYAGRGTTFQANTFGTGIETPMTSFDLTDFDAPEGPVANQSAVHFRLYAWGSNTVGDRWTLDNVRVGPPVIHQPFYELFCFDEGEATAFSTNPTLDRGELARFVRGAGALPNGANVNEAGSTVGRPSDCPVFSSGTNQAPTSIGYHSTPDLAAASTANKYYEFIFDSPAATLEFHFDVRSTSTGPTKLAIISSEAGEVAKDVAITNDSTFRTQTFTMQGSGSGTHSVRIYAYAGGGAGGTTAGGTFRVDNVWLKEVVAAPQ